MLTAELLSAAFSLASAASWGAGDFCGGLAARRAGAFQVVIGSQAVGIVLLAVLAVATGERLPSWTALAICGLAGLAGAIGLLCLYRALAEGRMGIAAPVSGVLSAGVPVIAAAFVDGVPGAVKLAGFGVALLSVWLISRGPGASVRPRDLGLPILAGCGFGLFIILIGRANAGAVFWPLVAARAASLVVLTISAGLGRQPALPGRGDWPLLAASGVLDAGGNTFLVLAAQTGRLDVAAVLSSLYPASTVLLAGSILKEHLSRRQMLGVLAALAAIVLITI
jgi:uncharacterized membrane protein